MLSAFGALVAFLGIWLMLCDSRNDFAPALLVAGVVCIIAGA